MAVLEARGIAKKFESTVALHNVNFDLAEGEVHALLGENGAGKSTLAKIMAGVIAADRGEFHLRGRRVEIRNPVQAQALGIGMVFQELDLFPHLSVVENMAVGNTSAAEGFLVRRRSLKKWCTPFLRQVGLELDPSTTLGSLPVGSRQLVAIARALSMNARILLMDEPTSSLSQANVETLFTVVDGLRRHGVSTIYVSHKMEEVQRLCDRVTVLRDGIKITTEHARARSIGELIELMVGRRLSNNGHRVSRSSRKPLLTVNRLSTRYISGVRFELREGEILGIAGLVGAGRSEIGAALFGMASDRHLTASLSGEVFEPISAADAMERGLCLLPEERKTDSIFPSMTVLHNVTMSALGECRRCGLVSGELERAVAERALGQLNLKDGGKDIPILNISGGGQQKAILARCLLTKPRVLFLDEPTRGIDVGSKEKIYVLLDDLVATGVGVILVSSELPELVRCCDRIVVMHNGKQVGIVNAVETTQQELLALATGQVRFSE